MKTLTIRIPDALAKAIEQESLARHVSKSDVVRERLAQPSPFPVQEGGLLDILETGWAASVPSMPRCYRSPHKQRIAEAIRAKKLPN